MIYTAKENKAKKKRGGQKQTSHKLLATIVVIIVVFLLIWVLFLPPAPGVGPTPSIVCAPEHGFGCTISSFYGNALTIGVGGSRPYNWNQTYILYVPQGQTIPNSTVPYCPPAGTSSISNGIACYNATSTFNGTIIVATFVLNAPGIQNKTYFGSVWAEYQNGTSQWHIAEIGTFGAEAI